MVFLALNPTMAMQQGPDFHSVRSTLPASFSAPMSRRKAFHEKVCMTVRSVVGNFGYLFVIVLVGPITNRGSFLSPPGGHQSWSPFIDLAL